MNRESELREDNKFLNATIRELRTRLDETTFRLQTAKNELYERVIRPQLELEDLISRYNGGMFDDLRTDRVRSANGMAQASKNHPTVAKYKDAT